MFIYNQSLLLYGEPLEIAKVVILSLVGCVALGAGITGYFLKKAAWIERIPLIMAGLALIYPNMWADIVGIVIFGVIACKQWFTVRHESRVAAIAIEHID